MRHALLPQRGTRIRAAAATIARDAARAKLLSHNDLYRFFVSCKPMVLCNDVRSHVEKFLPWNCVAARSARTCVRTASDISGVNECVYSSSEDEDEVGIDW